MTKKEIKEYEEETKRCIEIIEQKLNVTFWYYENQFKVYRFSVANHPAEALEIPRSVMVAICKNVC